MPYFHVDDQLHDKRETRAAGLEAMGLHEVAGSWSAGMMRSITARSRLRCSPGMSAMATPQTLETSKA